MPGRHRGPRARNTVGRLTPVATALLAAGFVVVVAPQAGACIGPPPGGGPPATSPAALLGALSESPHGPGGTTPASVAVRAPAAADPVSGAAGPLQNYVRDSHLNRGAGAQVQDVSEFDSWAKTHQALLRAMLDPEVGKSSTAATTPVTGPLVAELDAAHWNASPLEQAKAVGNADSWNLAQVMLVRRMLEPFVGAQSALGMAPGTGVVMHHLDNGHWNQSANSQLTFIVDDFPDWYAGHAMMAQDAVTSAASGSTRHGH
jgi:hypothetical protein